MTPLTPEALTLCHVTCVAHLDGSDKNGKWFAEMEQVIEHPRLQRMTKTWRKRSKAAETTWWLDGVEVGTREAAIELLNSRPRPEVTILEMTMLDQIGDDWTQTIGGAALQMMTLRDKGLVEFNTERRGQVRRTELARKILKGDADGQ